MFKTCFENSCSAEIIARCSCANPNIYACGEHLTKHIRTTGLHTSESLIIELDNNQRNEISPRLKIMIKCLQDLKTDIIMNAKQLTDSIKKETKQMLKDILRLEINAFKILSKKAFSKESYEKMLIFDLNFNRSISNKVANTKSEIKEIFTLKCRGSPLTEFDNSSTVRLRSSNDYYRSSTVRSPTDLSRTSIELNRHSTMIARSSTRSGWASTELDQSNDDLDHVIFSNNMYNGGHFAIDLNSFRLWSLDYAPKIGTYSHACKIDRDHYFFHGGRLQGNSTRSGAYIINIRERKYDVLKDGPAKDLGGGTVWKRNKVFLFGGNNGGVVNTCECFDLLLKDWKVIHPLPKASYSVLATLLNQEIVLSGFHHNCLYYYNESAYTSILALPANSYKIISEGWVYVNSILYEYNSTQWIAHRVNGCAWNNYLWINTIFKQREYLYFIDINNSLMRIDTNLKKLEKIAYYS